MNEKMVKRFIYYPLWILWIAIGVFIATQCSSRKSDLRVEKLDWSWIGSKQFLRVKGNLSNSSNHTIPYEKIEKTAFIAIVRDTHGEIGSYKLIKMQKLRGKIEFDEHGKIKRAAESGLDPGTSFSFAGIFSLGEMQPISVEIRSQGPVGDGMLNGGMVELDLSKIPYEDVPPDEMNQLKTFADNLRLEHK